VYQQVAERYPNTRQAEAARLAAAALRLEHLDDAEGAASEYRASAALRGQLSEEAAYGLAEAHGAAGKTDLEKRQLEQFIASYPKSPLAPSARRRLIEIEAR
jgi:TolA-binding protein